MGDGGTFWAIILGLAIFVFLVWVYFLPTLKAVKVKHPDENAIFVLNLLLGWALVPWVIALVWAYKSFPVHRLPDGEIDESVSDYKKCPYCAEPILIEAVKCRYCGSSLIENLPGEGHTQSA